MSEIADIRERLVQDVFDYQALVDCLRDYSKPRDRIGRLVAAGDIVRIRQGLYAFAAPLRRGPIVREQLANQIHGPSYVSLESALSYHGLIPERVASVTSVCIGRSRVFETPFGVFRYRMLSQARYAEGALLLPADAPAFLMASAEKALADKVWTDKRFSGSRLREFGPYLLDDLRVSPDALANLELDRLLAVEKAYGSAKIRNLARFVQQLREGSGCE